MHENSDNASLMVDPETMKTFGILEKKKELVEMWDSVSQVCKVLLAKAKSNPEGVKASLLKEVVNSLKALREIVDFAQELEREIQEAEEDGDEEEQAAEYFDDLERVQAVEASMQGWDNFETGEEA